MLELVGEGHDRVVAAIEARVLFHLEAQATIDVERGPRCRDQFVAEAGARGDQVVDVLELVTHAAKHIFHGDARLYESRRDPGIDLTLLVLCRSSGVTGFTHILLSSCEKTGEDCNLSHTGRCVGDARASIASERGCRGVREAKPLGKN